MEVDITDIRLKKLTTDERERLVNLEDASLVGARTHVLPMPK